MPSVPEVPILVYLIAPPMVCWGLERLVQSARPRLELAGASSCVNDSVGSLRRHAPHVVVLDLEDVQPEQSIKALLDAGSAARLLLLTASKDVAMLDRAILAGVRGVVHKHEPAPLLLKAIERVHEGELWIDRAAISRIFMEMARQKAATTSDPAQGKIATLTVRERKTIAAVTSDASAPAKVIAGRLCISEHTLRNHLTSVYAKLGLASRLDLYAFAVRHGLNQPH